MPLISPPADNPQVTEKSRLFLSHPQVVLRYTHTPPSTLLHSLPLPPLALPRVHRQGCTGVR
ncbi:hypothetical protein E2C01_049320 [Portunus trituberculatus]|uniref:Uncharacterized protein n=1 Tax=Portunus trituberculatus TaxID=210409 RepID=A0A5B7GCU3_PORTR|nr:hypothetical protein [Portunus trituberculatus]